MQRSDIVSSYQWKVTAIRGTGKEFDCMADSIELILETGFKNNLFTTIHKIYTIVNHTEQAGLGLDYTTTVIWKLEFW